MFKAMEEQILESLAALFDATAVLIGSVIVASLIALLTVWVSVGLIKKLDPKFSNAVEAWRPTLAIGGAVFAGALVFLQVALYLSYVGCEQARLECSPSHEALALHHAPKSSNAGPDWGTSDGNRCEQ